MRFKFPNADVATGFADGLDNPEEFDVVASAKGDEVEILGLDDDAQMVASLTAAAESADGVRVPPTIEGAPMTNSATAAFADAGDNQMQEGASQRPSFERMLWALRDAGWCVASHNDYRQNGQSRTFWLLTHPSGLFVKGEGGCDMDALMECDAQARKYFRPSP